MKEVAILRREIEEMRDRKEMDRRNRMGIQT